MVKQLIGETSLTSLKIEPFNHCNILENGSKIRSRILFSQFLTGIIESKLWTDSQLLFNSYLL
jgi:hypothetical protein